MNLTLTGSSGFVGTNSIKNFQDLDILEVDILTQKVDEIDFTGIDAILHIIVFLHLMKVAPEGHYS